MNPTKTVLRQILAEEGLTAATAWPPGEVLKAIVEEAFDSLSSYRFTRSDGMLFVEGRMQGQLVNLQGTLKNGVLTFQATRSLNTKGEISGLSRDDLDIAAGDLRDQVLFGRK